ncbi:MAG: hypothetical protein IH874_05205 [Candidatus Dadabacteria bacterium]|nr:hypothetical protein [Candidatus Dadabacteria bacterium]
MDIEKIQKLLEIERDVGADYHFIVGKEWRMFGEKNKINAPLAYSAFEFRCAIEHIFLELYETLLRRKLNKKEIGYDFVKLKKALYKTQGQGKGAKEKLKRRFEFNRICAKFSDAPKTYWPAVIDIEQMQKYWSTLSEYCHSQAYEGDTWGDLKRVSDG